MIHITIFKNLYDNKTDGILSLDTWNDMVDLLWSMSKLPAKNKNSVALISPAIYKEGTTRSIKNVRYWARWAAIDVDEMSVDANKLEETIQKTFGEYDYVAYSTASSTKKHPKFRVVFPLTNEVLAKDIPHFWYALNKIFGEVIDQQTKDMTRMFYIPAEYDGAYNFYFESFVGKQINPRALMNSVEYTSQQGKTLFERLPTDIQQRIVNHAKDTARNTNISWTNYKDCPFVDMNKVAEYGNIAFTDGSGRYRSMYNIMVSIACRAVKREYPITPEQIAVLINEIDNDYSKIYTNRPIIREAENALHYAYCNNH